MNGNTRLLYGDNSGKNVKFNISISEKGAASSLLYKREVWKTRSVVNKPQNARKNWT